MAKKILTSKIFAIIVLLVFGAGVIQIGLGVNLAVLLFAVIIISISLVLLRTKGIVDMGVVIFFIFVTNTVTISLIAKTILLQPIDSNLYDPFLAFGYTLICIFIFAVTVLLTDTIKIKSILSPVIEYDQFTFIANVSFLVGSFAWFMTQFFGSKLHSYSGESEGVGGIYIFKDMLVLSVIATTASLSMSGKKKNVIFIKLILLLSVLITFGLIDNEKRQILVMFLGVFVTMYYFGELKLRHIIIGTTILLFLSVSVFPIIQAIRYEYLRTQDIGGRLSMIMDEIISGDLLTNIDSALKVERDIFSNHYYYNYFKVPVLQPILDRFSSIQEIDPILYMADVRGLLGLDLFLHDLQSIVPHIIFPDKDIRSGASVVTTSYGLMSVGQGAYPTVPLIASVYAAFGMGSLLLLLIVWTLFILCMKLFGSNLYKNIYAIFIITVSFNYIAEGDLSYYLNFILRSTPIYLLLLFAIQYSYHSKNRRRIISN